MIKFLLAFFTAFPEIMKLMKNLDDRRIVRKSKKSLKKDIKAINKAFRKKDEEALNKIFGDDIN